MEENQSNGAPAPNLSPAAPGSEPPAQATPPAPEVVDTDDQEWEEAQNEVFPDANNKEDDEDDEPAKPKEDGEEEPADPKNPDGEKPDEEQGDDPDAPKPDAEKNPPAPNADERTAREAARSYAQQLEAVKTDIVKQMFADVPETLTDGDGDPINTVEDVMKLRNPRTGEAFTEDEAGMWLLSAQQQFNTQRASMEKQAEQIAEVQLDLKDQADAVNAKYGEFLRADPALRTELWLEYSATLIKDEKSGTITKMPLSLEKFYERALGPRVEAQQKQQADAAATQAAKEQAEKDAETKRQQARSDRSDIYGGSQLDTRSDEDKEWAEAEKEVFG